MKILIFTPSNPRAPHIYPETRDSIFRAMTTYDGVVDWHMCHNDNPHDGHPFENVLHNHQKGRTLALQGGYDAMLSIEADMIVPEHTIQALIDADADIAYGLYVWRVQPDMRTKAPPRWSAYRELTLWGGESICLDRDEAAAKFGSVIDVQGLGLGCTLIKRDALEAMPFRVHDGNPGWIEEEYAGQIATWKEMGVDLDFSRPRPGMVANDWLLAMDAAHYGFTQRAHLGVVCGHICNDEVLWPDTQGMMYRVEARDVLPVS